MGFLQARANDGLGGFVLLVIGICFLVSRHSQEPSLASHQAHDFLHCLLQSTLMNLPISGAENQ